MNYNENDSRVSVSVLHMFFNKFKRRLIVNMNDKTWRIALENTVCRCLPYSCEPTWLPLQCAFDISLLFDLKNDSRIR